MSSSQKRTEDFGRIPDKVPELFELCFREWESLRRVTLGPSSLLERIGDYCFAETEIREMTVPDGVREMGEGCFCRCGSLRRLSGPVFRVFWTLDLKRL